ncbi:MAG: hypothetical protein V7606_4578 [Burkholderiales bacterium]
MRFRQNAMPDIQRAATDLPHGAVDRFEVTGEITSTRSSYRTISRIYLHPLSRDQT